MNESANSTQTMSMRGMTRPNHHRVGTNAWPVVATLTAWPSISGCTSWAIEETIADPTAPATYHGCGFR